MSEAPSPEGVREFAFNTETACADFFERRPDWIEVRRTTSKEDIRVIARKCKHKWSYANPIRCLICDMGLPTEQSDDSDPTEGLPTRRDRT